MTLTIVTLACLGASFGRRPDSALVASGVDRFERRRSSSRRGYSPRVPTRFQKYNDTLVTLPYISYPLDQKQTELSLPETPAVSPRWFGHRQVTRSLPPHAPSDIDGYNWVMKNYLNHSAFWPEHRDMHQTFWQDMDEVVAAQKMRKAGAKTKEVMPVHPLFDPEETMDDSAQRVRADFPTQYPVLQIERFLQQGLKLDLGIFRRPECGLANTTEFVNGAAALSGLAGWAITKVSPVAFGLKWHEGRQRPEEVAQQINQDGVKAPSWIRDALWDMSWGAPSKFTAYPEEGSPVHPAWPGMHAAASSLSTWLFIVADLTEEQLYEARLLDFSIAYYRTLAGVNYQSDNRAGLELARRILQEHIPDFLANTYGCDDASEDAIRFHANYKISLMDHNWATWTPLGFKPPTLLR